MRQATVLVLAFLMSDVAAADVVRHGVIPEAYRGRWIESAETEPHRSIIALSAKAYVGPAANCSVDWVSETASMRGSIYAAHLQCVDPAAAVEKRTTANLIIWPENSDRIAVGPEFTNLKIFRRCVATCDAQAAQSDH